MKHSELDRIFAGTRAIHRVEFPLVNLPGALQADQPELAAQRAENMAAAQPGQAPPVAPPTPEVGVRVLTGEETAEVYQKAWADAQKRGATKPDETDPVYALALSVWTLAYACVDPDSKPADPEPFFGWGLSGSARPTPEQGAAEIYASTHLGRDGIAYLAEAHELWQDLCHPQGLKLEPEQVWVRVVEAVGDDPRFFLRMRPGLRWNLLRSMANLLVASLPDKSALGSSSEPTGKSERTAARKAKA